MLKSIALILALAVSGLAISAVSANAGGMAGSFTSHNDGQGQAGTSCNINVGSYCN